MALARRYKTINGKRVEVDLNTGKPLTGMTGSGRTAGLLQKAKDAAVFGENEYKNIQREAERYAAQMRQARIDAINTAFAPRIDRERKEGEGRLARVSALNFNKGIVGSGVDTTKTTEQKNLNEESLGAIENEKAVAINEAFGYADELARQRASDLYTQKKDFAEQNVNRYKEQYDLAVQALESFGKGGVTLEDIEKADANTLKILREVGGLDDFEIVSILNRTNPSMNAKTEFRDGVVYQYYTDPKTGKVNITTTKAPDDTPPNYKPQFAPDGTLLLMPDKFNPDQPLESQIKRVGKYTKPTSGGITIPEMKKPTWEEYLDAAQEEAGQTLTPAARAQLKKQYDTEFNFKVNLSGFTSQELKRLEQAGLLNAPRQNQLDFLYGDDEEGGGDSLY